GFLCLVAAACGAESAPSGAAGGAPVTESETGRIVDQPIDIEAFSVDVTEQGSAVFVISGRVPSPCHEAVFGFEEPDDDGVMLGTTESWFDPSCTVDGGATGFSLSMELTDLAVGDYIARLDGTLEERFSIPELTTDSPTQPSSRREPQPGTIDGLVLTSPPLVGEPSGMSAEVTGALRLDEAANCVLMELEGVRYPVVWPAGTRWQEDPPAVILKDGETIEIGMAVYGGGGYLNRQQTAQLAGPAVAEAAARCAGPTGEIAFFNIGTAVDVIADQR
ncbi:MAG: hypothetical protein QNJ89_10475, partial [Acidimicrobiia bacterium]|nr:hypothetical protein [Acidimicrobiia bacterium]